MSKLSNQIIDAIREVAGKNYLPLHQPIFDDLEKENLKNCIDTTYVSTVGQYVNDFERNIAEFTGAKYAIAVVNGTSALHLALKLIGVDINHEVICPSLTFIGTVNAISYLGAKPHFVDCDEKTLGIDPIALSNWLEEISIKKGNKTINKKTGRIISAIVPMHTYGHPAKIDQILEISKEYNLKLVEDAAESLGSFYNKKHTGTFGDIGILSFNGNKIITTGGGGALLTNDEFLAKSAKHISSTAKVPHEWRYIHNDIGFNYRLPNINAALGCAQLEKIDKFLDSKRKLFFKYKEAFDSIDGIRLFNEPENSDSNYWLQTIILENGFENELENILKNTNKKNIMTRPAWNLIHQLDMYLDAPKSPLPVSESLSKRIINIPSSAFLI